MARREVDGRAWSDSLSLVLSSSSLASVSSCFQDLTSCLAVLPISPSNLRRLFTSFPTWVS